MHTQMTHAGPATIHAAKVLFQSDSFSYQCVNGISTVNTDTHRRLARERVMKVFVLLVFSGIAICLFCAGISSLCNAFILFNFHYLDSRFEFPPIVENGSVPSFVPRLLASLVCGTVGCALLYLCREICKTQRAPRTMKEHDKEVAVRGFSNPYAPPTSEIAEKDNGNIGGLE